MKRLLKISLDLSLLSFIPILSWFCLSLIIDRNLINIFTLTYPIQFIWYILKSIFSTGANISKEKDKNKDAVMSGIIVGSLIAIIIYGLLALNIASYINFMNMDVDLYKNFAVYSILQLFIQLVFMFIIEKLYYEEKNSLANRYSISFNLLNFVVLIGTSLITRNQIVIISITLLSILIFTTYIFIKHFDKFKFNIPIKKWIKYDSVELFNNVAFFFIFLFGLSNAMEFGTQYTLALTFVALITDCQWDTFDAIVEAANIDISKKKFNYKEHIKNGYKLLLLLLLTVFIMFAILFRFYDLDMKLVAIYFGFELINFSIYPIYRINTCYLQLEYSAIKTTSNKIVASILRFLVSLLPTPFCTGLGQICSSIYQFITTDIMLRKNYVIDENNFIKKNSDIFGG